MLALWIAFALLSGEASMIGTVLCLGFLSTGLSAYWLRAAD